MNCSCVPAAYRYYVNLIDSKVSFEPDPANGTAVRHVIFREIDGKYHHHFRVSGCVAIEFVAGAGLTKVDSIDLRGFVSDWLFADKNVLTDKYAVLGGPWGFDISYTKESGQPGSFDPKIYNDGPVIIPPALA